MQTESLPCLKKWTTVFGAAQATSFENERQKKKVYTPSKWKNIYLYIDIYENKRHTHTCTLSGTTTLHKYMYVSSLTECIKKEASWHQALSL